MLPLPTDAEWDILKLLWREGPLTVREAHGALSTETGYTTTLKQMQVMHEKGLLTRNERFKSHVYEPAVSQDEVQRNVAGDVLRRAFEGSAKSLVMGALRAQPVSERELDEIRSMLAEFEASGPKATKKGRAAS